MQQQDMLRMANQIASFFNGSGPEAAVRDAADHINKFWDPRMRTMLIAHLDKGGEGLDETIVKAASLIKRPKPADA
ncbi:formate dehydrogenase subunit delta [Aestuariivirga sp.]|uniref:formate dehydrogenase subunit delta n=1 Tax=Aestuariivirga sp. TaxID=2650926 RepID=UPI003BA8CDA0